MPNRHSPVDLKYTHSGLVDAGMLPADTVDFVLPFAACFLHSIAGRELLVLPDVEGVEEEGAVLVAANVLEDSEGLRWLPSGMR